MLLHEMQLEFANVTLPPTRPLLKLSSCEDFFDRDYDTLSADVDAGVFEFAWNIATPGAERREIRVWRDCALAVWHNKKLSAITEEEVYKLILPNRNLRSTELRRIFSCSQELIQDLDAAKLLQPVCERRADSGPNAYTLYTRESIVAFLKSRRVGVQASACPTPTR